MTHQYELKLANGKSVIWEGEDAINAAKRYVDCHREDIVIAWREYPRYGIFLGTQNIIE